MPTLEQGFSASIPFVVTDGPVPTVDVDTLATVTSGDPASVRVVYPDPTDGVANPKRSIRVDALSGTGANVQLACLGHNAAALITVTPPVNRGTSSFGEPSAAFRTPAA
jgi:hypothetical protein